MHERHRFYTPAYGRNDAAVAAIIRKATELESQLGNVSRITFIAIGLNNDGWLERQYGIEGVKKLKRGTMLPNSKVISKFESVRTYNSEENEILITLGLESDEILNLDDNFGIKAIFSLPWIENSIEKWSKITNAINIDDNIPANSYPDPQYEVIKAFEELSQRINMSTGLSHPSDEQLAKTYLRTLVKYNVPLNELEIESYLIKQLNWFKRHSNDLLDIIQKINSGRRFIGGDNTGL